LGAFPQGFRNVDFSGAELDFSACGTQWARGFLKFGLAPETTIVFALDWKKESHTDNVV